MRPRTARRIVRAAGLVLALGGLVTTAACSGDDKGEPSGPAKKTTAAPPAAATTAASPSASPSPSIPPPSLAPAANAGGLCESVTFGEVSDALGITFEVAAAGGKRGAVRTCVLMPVDAAVPDLTFVATPLGGDKVSADDYAKDFVPDKSSELDGIGRAGYQQLLQASGEGGPVVRIGWLGEKNVYTLSLTTEKDTGTDAAKAYIPKLKALGPKIIPT